MKKVLILVLSSQQEPYNKMIETSLNTWDSIQVDNVETLFYCGNPVKENTDKIIYFPINESLFTMGEKMLLAFEWVLKNKEFDYIARVNSSCFVDKKELIKYCDELPYNNVFAGLEIKDKENWIWGGGQFVISKDVAEKIVDNNQYWRHDEMEDKSLSFLVNRLSIPYTAGKCVSINKTNEGWGCLVYGGGDNFNFSNFDEFKKPENQFFYRVKQDGKRHLDEFIMNELMKWM